MARSTNPEHAASSIKSYTENSHTISELEEENSLDDEEIAKTQSKLDRINSLPSVLHLMFDLRDICTSGEPESAQRLWLSLVKEYLQSCEGSAGLE